MAPTTQQLLDEAKQALQDILTGRTQEFGEGQERARLLRITELRQTIQWLQSQLAQESGGGVKRLRGGVRS